MAHEIMPGLIEGLPDAVALTCLARVPFYYHRNLRLVCRSWRAALCSPEIFKARCEAGVSEELLCVIHRSLALDESVCQLYDPFKGLWLTPTAMPSQLRRLDFFGVASVAGKLFILGGSRSEHLLAYHATSEVWSYDPLCCEWSRRADMLFSRFSFACCSLDGKIVVAGGFTSSVSRISKAEIYDPDTDTWRSLPDLPQTDPSDCSGAVIRGKIHVLYGGLSVVHILEDGQQWSVRDFGWPNGPMAVVREELYVLDGRFILKQHEDNTFSYCSVVPGHHSPGFDCRITFRMVGLGDVLYVIRPRQPSWWNRPIQYVDAPPVNNHSSTLRMISLMPQRTGIIQQCALLKI